jgi:hypothetical protein
LFQAGRFVGPAERMLRDGAALGRRLRRALASASVYGAAQKRSALAQCGFGAGRPHGTFTSLYTYRASCLVIIPHSGNVSFCAPELPILRTKDGKAKTMFKVRPKPCVVWSQPLNAGTMRRARQRIIVPCLSVSRIRSMASARSGLWAAHFRPLTLPPARRSEKRSFVYPKKVSGCQCAICRRLGDDDVRLWDALRRSRPVGSCAPVRAAAQRAAASVSAVQDRGARQRSQRSQSRHR